MGTLVWPGSPQGPHGQACEPAATELPCGGALPACMGPMAPHLCRALCILPLPGRKPRLACPSSFILHSKDTGTRASSLSRAGRSARQSAYLAGFNFLQEPMLITAETRDLRTVQTGFFFLEQLAEYPHSFFLFQFKGPFTPALSHPSDSLTRPAAAASCDSDLEGLSTS